jgi:TonB family protein
MRVRAFFSILFSTTLLLSTAVLVRADDAQKKQQTDTLFANAAVANLRSQNSPPFHLRLEIHATHLSPKPLDGMYDELWRSPGAWQRQISFPGFAQQEVGDSDGRWLARNLDFRPHAIYLMARAVDSAMPVPLWPDEQVKKVFDRKKDGVDLHCAEFKRGNLERTLCFDSRGPLANAENHNESDDQKLRWEYLDFQKFGEKLYPRQMRVYQNGEQVLDIRIVELSQLQDGAPVRFEHAPSAHLMAVCERWEPGVPTKKLTPQYPPEARRNHRQGVVTLYGLLAADGSVDQLKLLDSSGEASLDNASIQAVKQWVYAPADCGTKPLPTEIEVQVSFTLREG